MRVLILATVAAIALSGCAQSNRGEFHSATRGFAIATEPGVVASKRPVEIATGGSGLGTAIGAVSGGIIGSQIGRNRSRRGFRRSNGSVLGAFGGVIIGGILGNVIENDLSRQTVTEYVVKLDDGSLVTIVQENGTLAPGQRVFLQTTRGGFGQLVPSA